MFIKINVKDKKRGSHSQMFCLSHLPPISQTVDKKGMDLDK